MDQSIPDNVPQNIRVLLNTLPPLSHDREDRELLYQYSVGRLQDLSDKDASWVIQELAGRGLGVITFWTIGESMESRLSEGIRIARIQEKLGLHVAVDASRLLYGFFDGTGETAHIDKDGETFFDYSFADKTMGCPFSLGHRLPVITNRVTAYLDAYHTAGVNIDIVTADWEVDGPLEWNQAWENSRKCMRCQQNISNIRDFKSFQSSLRSLRSKLMQECYAIPVLSRYPDALVSNYATYPNNGRRYWFDYFEKPQPSLPHFKDQQAIYRPWYDEFTETGFTMAMPVIYTWYSTFKWYPEYGPDYRWFYNMLLVGSNAAKSTPSGIPITTFVHWHMTTPPENPDPAVKQMSQESYKELLWHLLLRGHDTFFSWCRRDELAIEMSLLQEVYNESLQYNDWFRSQLPVTFEVPVEERSVVSGLKWNNRLLVRRTDFKGYKGPVTIDIDGVSLTVPCKPGACQVLTIGE